MYWWVEYCDTDGKYHESDALETREMASEKATQLEDEGYVDPIVQFYDAFDVAL